MPAAPRRSLHARADLLDRPLVDEDGRLVGKVDDLELTDAGDGGPPRLSAVLTGPDALEPRLSRVPFRWWAARRRRRGRPARIVRIGFEHVREIGVDVVVPAGTRGYEESERRLRDRFVGRIPGARHADE
ncbi:PRC-barrel domain-containing protein [Pseudonocardia sichuanensis]